MQWVQVDGKTRLMVGERINRFIPNPTFDPVSKPGALDEYFRGRNPRGKDTPDLFGELDRAADVPEYRDRDKRIALMDAQGMGASIMLPTLGVGMEQALLPDIDAVVAAFDAFNQWILDDWGFAYQERIFAATVLTLADPAAAERTVDWGLAKRHPLLPDRARPRVHGIRDEVAVRSRLRRRVAEDQRRRRDGWSCTVATPGTPGTARTGARRGRPRRSARTRSGPSCRSTRRRTSSPTCWLNGVLERPAQPPVRRGRDRLRLGVPPPRQAEEVVGSDPARLLRGSPRQTFKRHVWVSPFYEDELGELKDLLGVDRILMGSDYPHAEGLADPSSYIKDLRNFAYTDDEALKVMRTKRLRAGRPQTCVRLGINESRF